MFLGLAGALAFLSVASSLVLYRVSKAGGKNPGRRAMYLRRVRVMSSIAKLGAGGLWLSLFAAIVVFGITLQGIEDPINPNNIPQKNGSIHEIWF